MNKLIQAFDPMSREPMGAVPATPIEDIPHLLTQARKAQLEWEGTSIPFRRQAFRQLREHIVTHHRRIIETISHSTSKPYFESLSAELWGCLETLRWCIDKAHRTLRPKPLWMGRYWFILRQSIVQRKPLGVIGIISPWNFPLGIPMSQILPSLMAGNAVLIKPSELTPMVGALIEDLFRIDAFPPHLVQVIHGGKDAGEGLVNCGVDKIIFTGSTRVGHQVASQAAKLGIPACLELGGKDAAIVCADAHLEKSVRGILWGAFSNMGQMCASIERAYVHRSLFEPFVQLLQKKMTRLRMGSPREFSDLGSLISEAQNQKYQAAVAEAKGAGAHIYQPFPHRSAPQPTLVTNLNIDSSLTKEEVFGPFLPIFPYENEQDVIDWVNQTPYGLSASIWTESNSHGWRLAQNLKVGSVLINGSAYTHAFPMAPWAGIKKSGWGAQHGRWGMEEVTRIHHIHYNLNKGSTNDFWWFGYTQTLLEHTVDLALQFTRPGALGWLLALFPFLAVKTEKKY